MTSHTLTVTTLSPLHIGSGEPPLRKGIDFVGFGATIYVFDTARVLDYVVGEDLALLEQVTSTQNLGSFLKEQDFREHPELALYRLRGTPSVREVVAQIKDVYDQPYLPGSSLKGALRTALLDGALLARGRAIDVRKLGDRDKYAALELEREIVGRGERSWQAPNYDLFRALHVADSAPGDRRWLTLSNVAVWPAGQRGIPIDVETVQSGVSFSATLKIDDYLFGTQAAALKFADKRELFDNLAATCRARAEARIAQERTFFEERRLSSLVRFYQQLADQLATCGPDSFLIQVGWGAGWGSKTVEGTLRGTTDTVAALVRRYRLDRGRGRGGDFPATRHVVLERDAPVEPLGWMKVTVSRIDEHLQA